MLDFPQANADKMVVQEKKRPNPLVQAGRRSRSASANANASCTHPLSR